MNKWAKLIIMVVLISPIFNGYAFANEKEFEDVKYPRIYSLVVDRFMNGNNENNKMIRNDNKSNNLPMGGDFQGIQSKLDYINDMGFNTVHISPVFSHDQNDFLGYKVNNYDEIDRVLGGEKAFKSLINEVHKKNMKMIVDMPVTYTKEFNGSTDGDLNQIQKSYFKDTKFIDLKDAKNQKLYKEKVDRFIKKYKVDGISMNIVQDGIDAKTFLPENIDTYGIINKKGISAKHFKHLSTQESRNDIQNAFKNVNTKIPDYQKDNSVLIADTWFTERFTKHAADENMFPGTRIKQLMTYMWGYKGPIMMNYGTEIAANGSKIETINQLQNFRTDKEVIKYLEKIGDTFKQYQELYEGDVKALPHDKGTNVFYYKTNTIDYILNINDSSKSKKVSLDDKVIEENKMLSGLIIGDNIKKKNGQYNLITDREETELYAVVNERGLNNTYLIAAILVIVLFGLFLFLVARKSKKQKMQNK
ncbi:alpha-amylase family protein [Mammaliicoccus sp. Dog046]|uniref:alpha-amylase family protein n=1 Tax=Mammaliicoccus sp. Dog046 TaxID=3034233 RepID=UPI002B25F34B|nr:alpha-amylase family protein [Mammaliicoccus sp. Dog046]WQK84854.1 alpha-amylase family protein [Mammaliicoccus sp. Dog046]